MDLKKMPVRARTGTWVRGVAWFVRKNFCKKNESVVFLSGVNVKNPANFTSIFPKW